MNKVRCVLVVFGLFFYGYCLAQTKRVIKPSKETTINYLLDKLSKYSWSKKDNSVYSASGKYESGESFIIFVSKYYSQFKLAYDSNRLFLTYIVEVNRELKSDKKGLKELFDSRKIILNKIPIDGIDEVITKDYYWQDDPEKNWKTEQNKIILKSNQKVFVQFDQDVNATEVVNECEIYLKIEEVNLLEKVKKAFMNLKSYCPKAEKHDPFEN